MLEYRNLIKGHVIGPIQITLHIIQLLFHLGRAVLIPNIK